MKNFDRITQQAGKMGGRPCIRGLRVTVGMIVEAIAAGATRDEILADYPYLEVQDIEQALAFAAWRAQDREIELSDS